ncbi:MAG: hypothetical protein ACNA7J_05415 [Wenzhouxiangella sp.]
MSSRWPIMVCALVQLVPAATLAMALALAITVAPDAFADSDPQIRIHPDQCEDWQTHIDALVESDDSLDNDIGHLYADPALRFCQPRQVRVGADREWNWDWNFFDLPDWSLLAWVVRALAIAALASLCIWLAWRWRAYTSRIRSSRGAPRPASEAPERGRLVNPFELPDDVPAAAQAAWQDNQPRLAMSLLYRGAASALLPRHAQQSRTEREVLHTLKANNASLAVVSYMNRLIKHWLRMAWANQPPSEKDFALLCQQWSRHCRRTSEAPQ